MSWQGLATLCLLVQLRHQRLLAWDYGGGPPDLKAGPVLASAAASYADIPAVFTVASPDCYGYSPLDHRRVVISAQRAQAEGVRAAPSADRADVVKADFFI